MNGIAPIVVFGIIVALVLNFLNGRTDAAQGVATLIATRTLSPVKAVWLTGICNMAGPLIFTTAVAATIGTAIVHSDALTPETILVAMLASTALLFCAARAGLPLSSSHALIGGLIGSSVAAFGLAAVICPTWDVVGQILLWSCAGMIAGAAMLGSIALAYEGDTRVALIVGAVCGAVLVIPLAMILGVLHVSGLFAIVLFILISPVLGMAVAFVFDVLISHLFKNSRQCRVHRVFSLFQIGACLFQASCHGANDGMHAVGIITALLVSAGVLSSFDVPFWVLLASALAIGAGTCFGGWNVIDRLARGITKIRPYQGFCGATAGSSTLALVTTLGIPVSSNHVISGAIIGVGVTRGKNAVQWNVVREMMAAWVVTIPLSAVCAFVGYSLVAAGCSLLG